MQCWGLLRYKVNYRENCFQLLEIFLPSPCSRSGAPAAVLSHTQGMMMVRGPHLALPRHCYSRTLLSGLSCSSAVRMFQVYTVFKRPRRNYALVQTKAEGGWLCQMADPGINARTAVSPSSGFRAASTSLSPSCPHVLCHGKRAASGALGRTQRGSRALSAAHGGADGPARSLASSWCWASPHPNPCPRHESELHVPAAGLGCPEATSVL